MMSMHLSRAAEVLKARQLGDDVVFRGISTDTRTLREGNLFVALQGPNFDGHNYIEQARDMGAVAAAVAHATDSALPQLEVADTRTALGSLAAYWRAQFELPLVAVTGSNGKTSVKEMLAAILSLGGETLVTAGNFNNEIGVPHTLFRLNETHRYAVLELGANHPGEIAYLTQLVQPTVALVNNAGPAHLEGFGDIAGVARAKGELFAHAGPDTVCIVNADDPYAPLWRELAAPRRVISFALEAQADVSADWQGDAAGSDLTLKTFAGTAQTHLALPGRHNVMNALAAAAAALAVGMDIGTVARGLAGAQTVHGRWEVLEGMHGCRLIDDTYNANPASLTAGLGLLADAGREAWLVLGDMGELGSQGEQLHREMGGAARAAGIRRLFTLGDLAAAAADAFGEGAQAFSDIDALNALLARELHPGVTLLVKGSRAMRMERVVRALGAQRGAAREAR